MACSSDEIEATIKRQYSTGAKDESFSIYQGVSSSGKLIFSKKGTTADDNQLQIYNVCIEYDVTYYIEIIYGNNYIWDNSTVIDISYQNDTIYKTSLEPGYNKKTDTFMYSRCKPNEIDVIVTRHYR